MEPFTNELQGIRPRMMIPDITILYKAGWLVAMLIALAFVIYVVIRRRSGKANGGRKNFTVAFKCETGRSSRKAYDLENLMAKLREILRTASVSQEGGVHFPRVDATCFVLQYGAGESIQVSADTPGEMAKVYWEMTPVVGLVSGEAFVEDGEKDKVALLRKMQELTSPHRA